MKPLGHDDEHGWKIAPLVIRFESVLSDKYADRMLNVLEDLNGDRRDRRYTKSQVALAFWKMLEDLVDGMPERMESLKDDEFSHKWHSRYSNFLVYCGEPELPPALAEICCWHCAKPIGEAGVAGAIELEDCPYVVHAECYAPMMDAAKRAAGYSNLSKTAK